jgi:hypothetical protein
VDAWVDALPTLRRIAAFAPTVAAGLAPVDWAAELLLPGGVLLSGSLEPEAEDRRVPGHLPDWLPEDRPDKEVRRILQEPARRGAPMHAAPAEPRSPVWLRPAWR